MQSQVGLRKHRYKQSKWGWWNSSWAISNPERWCCESSALNMPVNLENSAVATGLEKVSFHPIPKKGNGKECSNYRIIALISHASKVTLKILQARLNSTWTVNFQVLKLDLEKAEEPEIKLPTSAGSSKMQESSEKHLLLLYWLCQSLWLCGSQQTLENS